MKCLLLGIEVVRGASQDVQHKTCSVDLSCRKLCRSPSGGWGRIERGSEGVCVKFEDF